MTKTHLAGVSLVAALPAAVLAFYCVYGFLNHVDNMNIVMLTVNAVALLCAVVLILTPVAIMLKKGKAEAEGAAAAAPAVAASEAAGDKDIDADPFNLEDDGGDEPFDADDEAATNEDADLFEFDDEK